MPIGRDQDLSDSTSQEFPVRGLHHCKGQKHLPKYRFFFPLLFLIIPLCAGQCEDGEGNWSSWCWNRRGEGGDLQLRQHRAPLDPLAPLTLWEGNDSTTFLLDLPPKPTTNPFISCSGHLPVPPFCSQHEGMGSAASQQLQRVHREILQKSSFLLHFSLCLLCVRRTCRRWILTTNQPHGGI